MMRQQLTILIIIGFMTLSITGCENADEVQNDNNERTRITAVETVQIEPDSFDDYIRVSGVVEAIDDAVISAESSGRIQSIAERGASVTNGRVIAQLDDRLIRAQYEAAKTSFQLADDTYNRLNSLYADSIISTQDYESARAQRDQARAQLNQAEKQLQDTRIEAPFNGRVEERFIRTGELINPGMPVVRLVNTETVRILAGIPERFADEIGQGSPVVLNFRTQNGTQRTSRITFAGNVIDPSTRTFPIEIELSNSDRLIKPEMVVDIRVKRRTIENAIIIPRAAIIRDEEGTNVFVASEENGRKIASLVRVETGAASGPVVEITEGLQHGDEVVVTGMSTLSVGDRLNILKTSNSTGYSRELQMRERPAVSY